MTNLNRIAIAAVAALGLLTLALPGVALARAPQAHPPTNAHTSAHDAQGADNTADVDDAPDFDAKAASELTNPDGSRFLPDLEEGPRINGQASADATPNFRKSTRLAMYVAKNGDTIRAVAYRYCTSPVLLAMSNNLPFDAKSDLPLKPGTQLTVPIAFRAPSGLHEAVQLLSAPGIESGKPESNWGRPHFVQQLRNLLIDMSKHWPNRHPALVGSLSRSNGGRLGHHKSHRSGQDVDIGYFTYEANRKGWGNPGLKEIDYQRMWYFIDTVERSGLGAAMYMAPQVQRSLYQYAAQQNVAESRLRTIFQYGPKGGHGDTLIRFAPGHRDHFHVRMLCPEDFKDMVGPRST